MHLTWLTAGGPSRHALSACALLVLASGVASAAPPGASFDDPGPPNAAPAPVAAQPAPAAPSAPTPPPPAVPAQLAANAAPIASAPAAPVPPRAAPAHPEATRAPADASGAASDEPDTPADPDGKNGKEKPLAAPLDPQIARRLGGSAHADRVVLLPTAYTHPKGTAYVSDYDVFILQAGYAFTDSTQLTATFTPPIEEELVVPLDLSLKVSSDDGSRVRVAGMGSVTGILGLDDGPALVGRVGGTAQFCFDDACRSSVSSGVNAVLVGTVLLFAGTGAEVRVANWLSLLMEVDMAMPLGLEPAEAKGVLFAGGARLPFRNWALDLTVAGSASAFDGTGNKPVPLLVYTYRWLPSVYRHAPR